LSIAPYFIKFCYNPLIPEWSQEPVSKTLKIHPLAPLSLEELTRAVQILRSDGRFTAAMRIHHAQLVEPDKTAMQRFAQGKRIERRAFFVVRDPADGKTSEVVASLDKARVESFTYIPDVQPAITGSEYDSVAHIVKRDRRWRRAVKRRGLTDADIALAQVDGVACGNFGIPEDHGKRLVAAFPFYRAAADDNGYAHPIEGLIAYVDLDAQAIHRLEDAENIIPVPRQDATYDTRAVSNYRADLKPLEIAQPDGASFQVDGHAITWQKWSLRISFNRREGLVLHQIAFDDGGRVRPILFRASVSEMCVPYGDPRPGHYWMSVFDEGEYGLGWLVNSLELGCDCLGTIHYFDADLLDEFGEPYTIRNAICLHEEDYGVLWKHRDPNSDVNETRRSRRLVLSFFATVGNYDYGFFWYFYQDGTIQLESKLTGLFWPAGVGTDNEYLYGTVVAANLGGPIHQHLMSARLHWDLDGGGNSVAEYNTETEPWGEANAHGTAFVTRGRVLGRELDAMRAADPLRGRYWKVVNPNAKNRMGEPVGYKLAVMGTPPLLSHPGSSVAQRAGFAQKHLWVTRFHPREMYAAGDYPNQHRGGDGLPRYAAQNRNIENEDIVMWHTFGVTHNVRLEDYPVMPVEYCGFTLKPNGFFDRNPALDVPPPHHAACH
jgi:primary-amine oxidase